MKAVGDLFLNVGDWNQGDFIARLRMLLVGDPSRGRFKSYHSHGSDSWVLDEGNNWFLSFEANNVAWLRYRYPVGLGMDRWEALRRPKEVWDGLYHAITTLMHLNPLTPEQETAIRQARHLRMHLRMSPYG